MHIRNQLLSEKI
jgi:hypothetical protein